MFARYLPLIAGVSAGIALLCSMFSMVQSRARPASRCPPARSRFIGAGSHDGHGPPYLPGVSKVAGLLAGGVSAVILIYMLTVRCVYSILELIHGAPLPQSETFEFGARGLVMTTVLIVACLAGLRATGQRLLIAALFWLCVLAVFGLSLLLPLYHRLDNGTYARTAVALVSIVGLSLVLSAFVLAQGVCRKRSRWRAARSNPDALLNEYEDWPGLRKTSGAIGIVLALLICFQTAAPPTVGPIGPVLATIITAVCAATAGAAVFSLVGRRWSVNLADTAMGLVTLAVAAFAVAFVPSKPAELGARFPMVFNALMFALAVMSWFWVWLASVWRQQIDDGTAWTVAGRLAPVCENFAFFVACFALVLGSLMAIWPRLRPIATLDDSLGRVAAAVAAHLVLVLVLLWNGRTVGRSSFGALTILAVLSLVGFIVVRAGPFASTIVSVTAIERNDMSHHNLVVA